MKLGSLSLCFLLLAFFTNLPTSFSDDDEQVLDVNGNPIFVGGRYYILPDIRGPYELAGGGGIISGFTKSTTCPVTAIQDYSEFINGIPVKFSIAEEEEKVTNGIIFTGTKLNIEFTDKFTCAESSKWIVVNDEEIGQSFVGIGGQKNHPGKSILSGTFSIQTYGFSYQLEFCVKGYTSCSDIVRYDNGGECGRRLILTRRVDSFILVFVNADAAHTAVDAAAAGIKSVV